MWYLVLFQRYSSFPIMQIWSLMTSSLVQVQWCDTKLRISPPILKHCYWNLAGMLHLTKYTRWYTFFDVAMATCSIPVSCLFKIKYYHLWLKAKYLVYLRRMAVPPSLSCLFNIFSCIWCPVQLQIIIFDFEEAGDWNRACCHSNIRKHHHMLTWLRMLCKLLNSKTHYRCFETVIVQISHSSGKNQPK